MESMWAGETPKNVAAVFRMATEEDAVLFFDEADAIASRRSTGATQGYQRESNTVVSVLLRELEAFNGVVIFATNLAVNFDPAFERRIRTHVLFEMPGVDEREQIWKVQIHPLKTPLAEDVDFRVLAERYRGERRATSRTPCSRPRPWLPGRPVSIPSSESTRRNSSARSTKSPPAKA